MNKLKYIAAVVIGIAGLGLQQAKADVCSFNLTTGNTGLNGFSGPFVNVTINQVGNTATITFTSLTKNGNIYLMGDGSSIALNVNAASFSVGTITGTNAGSGFTPGGFTANFGSNQNVDNQGHFNFTIDSFDGFTHSSDSITFTLTNLSGTWNSCHDVLTANDLLNLAAAHIFVTLFPANAANGARATGFAGGNGQVVPDGGATVMLLGAGLGALGMVRRFLKT